MGVANRFTINIQLKGSISTHADLDTCAEVDVVSYQLVQLLKF
jgi:hypothetical protein